MKFPGKTAMTSKRVVVWLTILVSLTLAILVLPAVILRHHVASHMTELQGYTGFVRDVDVHFLEAAYTLHDIEVQKREGSAPVPFFVARRVKVTVGWRSLFSAETDSIIDFHAPRIHFVDSSNRNVQQVGRQADWLTMINKLSPVPVDRIRVIQGTLSFQNFDSEDIAAIDIADISAWAINLADSSPALDSLPAAAVFQGRLFGEGGLWMMARFEPRNSFRDFVADLRIDSVSLDQTEKLMELYAPLDVEGGDFNLVAELEVSQGQLEGYFKPLIHDLEIFRWKKDLVEDRDNPFQLAWESFADLLSELLENQAENQLATVIPVSGSLNAINPGFFSSLANLLRNAFIEAYDLQFESTETAPQETGVEE